MIKHKLKRHIIKFSLFRDYTEHCFNWAVFFSAEALRNPQKEMSFRPIEQTTLRYYNKILKASEHGN